MKIVEQHPEIPDSGKNTRLYKEDTLYFDIETTGLNVRRSHLYLLGAMWRENEKICLRQWFADTPSDEEVMIKDFLALSENFASLVHFNGDAFDLPYLCSKAAFYGLYTDSLKKKISLDLFRLYRPLKSILGRADMKLARLQQFCGYKRRDHHTGKELIQVYEQYLQTADGQLQKTLEQHNYDDIVGMLWTERLDTLLILRQEQLFPDSVSVTRTDPRTIELCCQFPGEFLSLPRILSCEGISLKISGHCCRIISPVYTGEYYYYYKDYRNYYYLPAEDRAIHKSIGVYVDPSARKKATADTCYDRKNSSFIREFAPVLAPALQSRPRKTDEYFCEISDAFLSDYDALKRYCTHIIGYMLKHL